MNAELATAALALVGTPFRLHGRDPATGLDCVGLLVTAMIRCGHRPRPPRGYALRSLDFEAFLPCFTASGLVPAEADGDVLLAQVHAIQPHLLISAPGGAVHAHAGLGRVVFVPHPLPWPITRQWCLQQTDN